MSFVGLPGTTEIVEGPTEAEQDARPRKLQFVSWLREQQEFEANTPVKLLRSYNSHTQEYDSSDDAEESDTGVYDFSYLSNGASAV